MAGPVFFLDCTLALLSNKDYIRKQQKHKQHPVWPTRI